MGWHWYRARWAELLRIEDVEFHAVGHDHVAGLLVGCAWADPFGSHGEGPAGVSHAVALRCHGHRIGAVKTPADDGMGGQSFAPDGANGVNRAFARRVWSIPAGHLALHPTA